MPGGREEVDRGCFWEAATVIFVLSSTSSIAGSSRAAWAMVVAVVVASGELLMAIAMRMVCMRWMLIGMMS